MSKRVLIKWGIVPAVITIIYFVTALSVGVNIVQAFIGIFVIAFYAALFLGWFWLLPLVPLSIAAAHSKSRWLGNIRCYRCPDSEIQHHGRYGTRRCRIFGSGKTNDFGKFELTEDIALDSGHYRAVFTDDDLFAAAEFTVR